MNQSSLQSNLYQFHNNLIQEGIIFCFSGPVTQHIVEGIGQTLKLKMEREETNINTTQKVFAIFVEQMQNIVNYSAKNIEAESQELSVGILIVGRQCEHFYVLCGNKINNNQIQIIQEKIEPLKDADKDQLKEIYKQSRKKSPHEGSKGAGLGFIDMARKASQPINIDFQSIDSLYSFFSIKVII
jgi:hypothetical protein